MSKIGKVMLTVLMLAGFGAALYFALRGQSTATAERTEVIGLVETIKHQLDGVDAALARLTEGKYGTCANCGKDIDPARMEARPESIYCVDCKVKLS